MSQKDYDRMMELLREQRERILTDKKYAKKLAIELGILTTRGTIRKRRRAPKMPTP